MVAVKPYLIPAKSSLLQEKSYPMQENIISNVIKSYLMSKIIPHVNKIIPIASKMKIISTKLGIILNAPGMIWLVSRLTLLTQGLKIHDDFLLSWLG